VIRLAISVVATIIANAVGLLLAATLLEGFRIDAMSFVIVLLVFTGVMVLTGPLVTKIAVTSMPQIRGSIALVTAFLGLKVTEWLMAGFDIGGLSNWLAATLLVWLGSLVAEILLPIYVFKSLRSGNGPNVRIQ
jgi:Mycobacterial 4 TMS phage holin, superfamily IV